MHLKKMAVALIFAALILAGCGNTGSAPLIPHEIEQRSDCKSCHATGQNGAKAVKHADRPNCTGCHQPQK